MIALASVAGTFQNTVLNGSFLLAVPIALIAGIISFLSPCVLPLVPGYIAYVTGLSGADLASGQRKGRIAAGSFLFILGFTVLFVLTGGLFGYVGLTIQAHSDVIYRVLGVLVIVFGLAFMGLLPGMQREFRIHRLPAAGVVGAPIVGFLFAVGWTPCLGPTLGAVVALAGKQIHPLQGAQLMLVFGIGLGIPFVLAALGFRWAIGAMAFFRRHNQVVLRLGGVLLIAVGILLVSGLWDMAIGHLQHYVLSNPPAV